MLPIMELEALNSQKQPIHLLTYLLHSVSKLLNCKKLGPSCQVLTLLHYLQFHQYQSFLVKFLGFIIVFMGFRIISLAESSTNLKKENHLYNLFNLFKCLLVSSSFISFVILIIVGSCSQCFKYLVKLISSLIHYIILFIFSHHKGL